MVLLLTDVFLLLTQVLLWMVVGLVAWFVLLRALPRAFLSLLVLLLILAILALSFVSGPPIDGGVLEILWRIISFPFTPLGLALVLLAILLSGTKLTDVTRRVILIGLVILALSSFPFVAYYLVQELELEAVEIICPTPSLPSGARRVIVLLGQGTTRSYLRPTITRNNALVPSDGETLSEEAFEVLAQLPLLETVEQISDRASSENYSTFTAFLSSQETSSDAVDSSIDGDLPLAASQPVNLEKEFLLAQQTPQTPQTPQTQQPPGTGSSEQRRAQDYEQRAQELERMSEEMKNRAEQGQGRLEQLNERAKEGQDRIEQMKKRAEELQKRAEELRRRAEERQQRIPQGQTSPSPSRQSTAPSPAASPSSPPKKRPKHVIRREAYNVLTSQPIQLTERGNRLIYAAQLYQQESGNNPLILVSASTRLDRRQKDGEKREEISESADIQRFLTTTMNVPASGILLEHNSRSVRRSAENVKKLLADQNINFGNQLTVVTTAMNMHRTALTFQRVFEDTNTEIVVRPTDFHTIPPPDSIGDLATGNNLVERQIQASDFLPNADALYLSTQAIDEYISSFYYFLRGWMADPLTLNRCGGGSTTPSTPDNGGTTIRRRRYRTDGSGSGQAW
jgi:uncharacterized SAM-binding protein YcdF (DUF218 family)